MHMCIVDLQGAVSPLVRAVTMVCLPATSLPSLWTEHGGNIHSLCLWQWWGGGGGGGGGGGTNETECTCHMDAKHKGCW